MKVKKRFGLKEDGTLGWIIPDSFFGKMSKAKDVDVSSFKPEFKRRLLPFDYVESVTSVDWLRFTATEPYAVSYIIDELMALVASTDIAIYPISRRHLGYDQAYNLTLWYNNNNHVIGVLAYTMPGSESLSATPGISIEFTGDGCQYLRRYAKQEFWLQLPDFIHYYNMRITRIDLALDLPGYYASKYNYTVPFFGKNYDHYFRSSLSRNGQSLKRGQAGDWSDIIYDNVANVDNYNPLLHCKAGITTTVGSRSSPNYFRIYEKGKQLAGLTGEDEDLAWIRIEQEIKRDKDGSNIPLEIILNPDAFFALNREIRQVMLDYAALMSVEQRIVSANRLAAKAKNLLLSKKIYWLRRTYGRTIRTLLNSGLFVEDIVEMIQRECGLKNLVFDLELKDYDFREIKGNI